MVDAAREAAKYQRELNAGNAGKVVAELKKSGMQVVENVDMAPFQKIVSESIAKTFAEKNGPALLQAIEATKKPERTGEPPEETHRSLLPPRRSAMARKTTRRRA